MSAHGGREDSGAADGNCFKKESAMQGGCLSDGGMALAAYNSRMALGDSAHTSYAQATRHAEADCSGEVAGKRRRC